MSKYRKIDIKIWNDEKFRALSDDGKLVWFFLLTHPSMTPVGAMRASLPGLAAELGWDLEAFREAFGEVLQKGMVEHDAKASFVALPNFLKYNKPESPNVLKSWIGCWDSIPECGLKLRLLERVEAFAESLPKGFQEAFAVFRLKACPKAMPNQEEEQEQEPEQEQDEEEDHRREEDP